MAEMSPEEGVALGVLILLLCPLVLWRFQESASCLRGDSGQRTSGSAASRQGKRTSLDGGVGGSGRSKRKGGRKKGESRTKGGGGEVVEGEKARLTEMPPRVSDPDEFEFDL